MTTDEQKTVDDVTKVTPTKEQASDSRKEGSRRKKGGSSSGRRQSRDARPRQEYDQKLLDIRRVARVAAGGRRFNFSVAVVIGDKKGSVGVGLGKAGDTSFAIDKAVRAAKKHMIRLSLTKDGSVSRDIFLKYKSARIMIKPAPGRGLVAGSAARNVIELAGVRGVTAKIFSPSKNKLNIARATILALQEACAKK